MEKIKPKKRGRPSVFTAKLKKQMEFLAKKGFTEQEMAEALGIDQSTITKYKQRTPDFFTTLKSWKAEADAKVERSLFERACGYSHPEDKIFNDGGKPLIVPTIKHYPPDPTSMIFWLKNRQPEKWREKQEEYPGDSPQPVTVNIQVEDGRRD